MPHTVSPADLTQEEDFLWHCARSWRTMAVPESARDLDWDRIVETSRWNRMQALLNGVLSRTGLLSALSAPALDMLRQDVALYRQNAEMLGQALRRYLALAAEQNVQTVVLKGLSVSTNVYGDPIIRPGGDVDLLVPKDQVRDSVAILESMGMGRYWPHLMDDAYYAQHHLHQQRCSRDIKVWVEVHWALDHPYTLLTIDYDALMARTTPGELVGQPVWDLAPPDLLLSLAVHLVKHAIYLPSVMTRADLARVILADGMLMYFLDVAEVIKRYDAELDWTFVVDLAQRSGAGSLLGSVLRACQRYLDAPVPEEVLDRLPVRAPRGLTRQAMVRLIDYELATYQGQERSRFWDFMLMTDESFILRPIRVLDTAAYFLPGKDYLQRRYGSASWRPAITHLVRSTGQYARLGVDTAYYSWKRNRRRKALRGSSPTPGSPSVDSLEETA